MSKQFIVEMNDTEYCAIKATPEKYKTLAHKILERGTLLPPHGRLIEESDAIAEIYDRFMSSDMCIYNQSAIKCIDIIGKAPTILKATKGESE